MNFIIFVIILFLGILSSYYICSKSNLPLKIRYKLDINSRNKVFVINIIVLLLLCFVYTINKRTGSLLVKTADLILFFSLSFIYYILKDIKAMIIKEEEKERERHKYKYENKFCYFCGYKLENDEKVCPNCGKGIGDGS